MRTAPFFDSTHCITGSLLPTTLRARCEFHCHCPRDVRNSTTAAAYLGIDGTCSPNRCSKSPAAWAWFCRGGAARRPERTELQEQPWVLGRSYAYEGFAAVPAVRATRTVIATSTFAAFQQGCVLLVVQMYHILSSLQPFRSHVVLWRPRPSPLSCPSSLGAALVYPRLAHIRDITASIATAVAIAAGEEGRLRGRMRDKFAQGPDAMRIFIERSMFYPDYKALVHLPAGIEE